MKKFQRLAIWFAVTALALSGCSSSGGDDSLASGLRVVFAAPAVNQSKAEAYGETLKARDASLPEVSCTAVSLGDSSKDPTAALAGMMKVSSMVAGKEIDVIFYDIDEAARDARSEMFYSMSDLFTQEELDLMQDRLIRYNQVDEEGNETAELTPECGLDVSDQTELAQILNSDRVGIFIVGNAQNLDAAKALLLSYVHS